MGIASEQEHRGTTVQQGGVKVIQKFGFINGVDNVNWPPYKE